MRDQLTRHEVSDDLSEPPEFDNPAVVSESVTLESAERHFFGYQREIADLELSEEQMALVEIGFLAGWSRGASWAIHTTAALAEPRFRKAVQAVAEGFSQIETRQLAEKYNQIYGSEQETGSVYDLPPSHRA